MRLIGLGLSIGPRLSRVRPYFLIGSDILVKLNNSPLWLGHRLVDLRMYTVAIYG